MIELLTAGPNLPFLVALALMGVIALMEGVGLLVGASLSHLVEGALPDVDLPDLDHDLDLDHDAHLHHGEMGAPEALHLGPGMRFLAWLHFGRVPVMVLFILFLASFGIVGIVLQALVKGALDFFLPAVIAAAAALFATVPFVRMAGGLVARVIPKDETSAVSEKSFVGRVAVVTLGTARRGEPAQARLKDQHGQSHYVMVEPDVDGDELTAGTHVLLVDRRGVVFSAIENPSDALVD